MIISSLIRSPFTIARQDLRINRRLLPSTTTITTIITRRSMVLLLSLRQYDLVRVVVHRYPPLLFNTRTLSVLRTTQGRFQVPSPRFVKPRQRIRDVRCVRGVLRHGTSLTPLPFLGNTLIPPRRVHGLLLKSTHRVPNGNGNFPSSIPMINRVLSLLARAYAPNVPASNSVGCFPLVGKW